MMLETVFGSVSELTSQPLTLDVAGKPLAGELVVPTGAETIVVFSAGTPGAQHASLEMELASQLHSQGVATLLMELISLDDSNKQAVRSDVEILKERLDAQFDWLDSNGLLKEMAVAMCGTGTGGAAALDYFVTNSDRVVGTAFLNARLDLAVQSPANISRPTFFYLEDAYRYLQDSNKKAYEEASVCEQYKCFLSDSSKETLNVVAHWFSWVFTQSMELTASASATGQTDPLRKGSDCLCLTSSEE